MSRCGSVRTQTGYESDSPSPLSCVRRGSVARSPKKAFAGVNSDPSLLRRPLPRVHTTATEPSAQRDDLANTQARAQEQRPRLKMDSDQLAHRLSVTEIYPSTTPHATTALNYDRTTPSQTHYSNWCSLDQIRDHIALHQANKALP